MKPVLKKRHPDVRNHLHVLFALLVVSLLATTGWVFFKEANPDWKRIQKAYYREEAEKAAKALAAADGKKRELLEKRLRRLENPRFDIRQILPKNTDRVDRCITCHLDLKQLEKQHPQIERFPFEEYGCTVCHGGVGRATESERAHSTLRIPRRPLFEYLKARAEVNFPIDLFRYSASGEPIAFTGSDRCLRCHLASDPKHVARWRKLKFKPLDKVRTKLEELKGKGTVIEASRCLSCHATGYDEKTGRYEEDRVTCEDCHGPGGFYAELMAGGRAREGAELARANILKTDAESVCLNCHKPGRHSDYEGEDGPPVVTAIYLGGEPKPAVDGSALEDAWDKAPETRVPTWFLDDGSPRPGTEVFVRALYDDANLYFAFRWLDETREEKMGEWVFTSGRWQAELQWPDALALCWQASDKVEDFRQGGCAVLCHTTGRFAVFPRMATRREGAVVDEWYWNAFTAARAGHPGDGFLDNRVVFIPEGSKASPLRRAHPDLSAAHGSDASGQRVPQTVGGIPLTLNATGTKEGPFRPEFTLEGGKRVPLSSSGSASPPGTVLPLYETGSPEGGDSADVHGRASWSGGIWTLELSRALQTPSGRDVQFHPPGTNETFGLAVWDGSAGDRHQVATLVRLRFEPRKE
jgi:hypothetical protein